MASESVQPLVARRAKIACKSCHARRVKCDASQSRPCWHCKSRQTPCELLESRRGRYQRVSRRDAAAITQRKSDPTAATTNFLTSPPMSGDDSTITINVDAHPLQHADLEEPGNVAEDEDQDAPVVVAAEVEGGLEAETGDGPEMLYARMADSHPDQDNSPGTQDDQRTFYLGEAFSLTFVVKTVCSRSSSEKEAIKVHYPLPPSLDDSQERLSTIPTHLAPEMITFLHAQGAFLMPDSDLSDALIHAFFQCFHPAWPVFDRRNFLTRYRQGTLSMLVLQAVFHIGVTVCDEELVKRTGFPSRSRAREAYYQRAKALYDADYELDKTQLTAVLFLLCFWWQQPQDQKDTWHWVGCALSLAQTLGMHRSTAYSDLNQRSRSLWKRIWWAIYIRERHAAAALGRPFRIRDMDCDIEPLMDVDFEVDDVCDLTIMLPQKRYHVAYFQEMSKLAVLLGRIHTARFSPKSEFTVSQRQVLSADLQSWEQQLPSEMFRRTVTNSLDASFWACLLQANFHNCRILLHRPSCVNPNSMMDAQSDAQARSAADETTRIAEDLLTMGVLRQGQVHLVPALFAALGIHAIVIQRKDAIQSQLAENRSRQCMLALSELAKSWPVGGWILRLFMTLMKRLTGREFAFAVSSHHRSKDAATGMPVADGTVPAASRTGQDTFSSQATNDSGFHSGHGLETQQFASDSHFASSQHNDLLPSGLSWDGDDQELLNFDSIFQQSLTSFTSSDFDSFGLVVSNVG